MTDLDKIAALAAHDALPRARVVLPWWARLLVWLTEPPPVRPLELAAGTSEAPVFQTEANPAPALEVRVEHRREAAVDDIVRAARRQHGDPVNVERVIAVARRLRLAGVTVAEVAAAIERVR